MAEYEIIDIEQGTPEWLALRKTKITATDASVIMGCNPWKTKLQLYNEKISEENNEVTNEHMQRGTLLEPFARALFTIKTGIKVKPAVIVNDWTMASLDGLSECGKHAVEIKCPHKQKSSGALSKKIPLIYYPQVQHIIWVLNLSKMSYFSFVGVDGIVVVVERDEEFIEKMILEEWKFYLCLQNRTPPEEVAV